ncbi:MAG: acyltransferase [Planctomycetota bacterium]
MPYSDESMRLGVGGALRVCGRRLLKTLLRLTPGNAVRIFLMRRLGYEVGDKVYVGEGLIVTEILEAKGLKLRIGERVSIAQRVTLVTASDPNWSRLAARYPPQRAPIVIEDDAWLGAGAIVLPGVTIGREAIVGAGAVVTHSVPPCTTVVGVPARPLARTAEHGLAAGGETPGLSTIETTFCQAP